MKGYSYSLEAIRIKLLHYKLNLLLQPAEYN